MLTLELPAPRTGARQVSAAACGAATPAQGSTLDARIASTPQLAAPDPRTTDAATAEHDPVLRWMPVAAPMAAVLLCASIGAIWALVP